MHFLLCSSLVFITHAWLVPMYLTKETNHADYINFSVNAWQTLLLEHIFCFLATHAQGYTFAHFNL